MPDDVIQPPAAPKRGHHQRNAAIRSGELYRSAQAKNRLGLGDWAWRRIRRDGLPVIYFGGKAFVLGDDIIEFFRTRRSS